MKIVLFQLPYLLFILTSYRGMSKSFIDIPIVNEIIINDDGSSKEEYKKLNKKISKMKSKFNLNIKVSNNKENKGGFKNKYITVSKCKNNVIYQIDSDNFSNK